MVTLETPPKGISLTPGPLAGVKEVDYRLYPSKDTQLQWLRSYLQAYKQLTQGEQGGAGPAVSDKELEALYVQVNKFSLVSAGGGEGAGLGDGFGSLIKGLGGVGVRAGGSPRGPGCTRRC